MARVVIVRVCISLHQDACALAKKNEGKHPKQPRGNTEAEGVKIESFLLPSAKSHRIYGAAKRPIQQ